MSGITESSLQGHSLGWLPYAGCAVSLSTILLNIYAIRLTRLPVNATKSLTVHLVSVFVLNMTFNLCYIIVFVLLVFAGAGNMHLVLYSPGAHVAEFIFLHCVYTVSLTSLVISAHSLIAVSIPHKARKWNNKKSTKVMAAIIHAIALCVFVALCVISWLYKTTLPRILDTIFILMVMQAVSVICVYVYLLWSLHTGRFRLPSRNKRRVLMFCITITATYLFSYLPVSIASLRTTFYDLATVRLVMLVWIDAVVKPVIFIVQTRRRGNRVSPSNNNNNSNSTGNRESYL